MYAHNIADDSGAHNDYVNQQVSGKTWQHCRQHCRQHLQVLYVMALLLLQALLCRAAPC
jgi:hypothetical protein